MSSTPLHHAPFRALWTAGLVSVAGDWLLFIALPVVVYQHTGSAFGTSAAFLLELVPPLLLTPLAGWCADHVDRRRLVVGIALAQAAALLPLLAVGDGGGLGLVYAVIVAQACLTALDQPARQSMIPDLVDRDDLVAANSWTGFGENVARLAGGPVGGVLLGVGGLHTVVLVDLATYVVAAVLLVRVRVGAVAHRVGGEAAPAANLRAVLRVRALRTTLATTFLAAVAQGVFVVVFVLFVVQRLAGGPEQVGLLRGVQAVGAVAGALALGVLARRASPGRLVAGGALVFGVVDLVVWNAPALTTSTWVYVVLFALIGAPGVVMGTGLVSAVQLEAPPALVGRAFSLAGAANNGGQALGMLGAGVLTAPLGLTAVLNGQAVVYLLAGVVAVMRLRTTTPRPPDGERGAVVLREELALRSPWLSSRSRP